MSLEKVLFFQQNQKTKQKSERLLLLNDLEISFNFIRNDFKTGEGEGETFAEEDYRIGLELKTSKHKKEHKMLEIYFIVAAPCSSYRDCTDCTKCPETNYSAFADEVCLFVECQLLLPFFRSSITFSIKMCFVDCLMCGFQILQPCSKLISSCIWNGKPFDCCKYFHPIQTTIGKCYLLNSIQNNEKLVVVLTVELLRKNK